MKKLIRNDLNDKKDELVYTGCAACRTRFTDKDIKDTQNNTICPLCMTETITNDLTSIMYDTDYELPDKTEPDKKIQFLKKIEKWESFTPVLTDEELSIKNKLEGIEWIKKPKKDTINYSLQQRII